MIVVVIRKFAFTKKSFSFLLLCADKNFRAWRARTCSFGSKIGKIQILRNID
jgi:hypothetical protein